MVRKLFLERGIDEISFLDPCVGPGTFVKAAIRNKCILKNDFISAMDLDEEMIAAASENINFPNITFSQKDYLTTAELKNSFDYIILNPPFIRQEWIDQKGDYIQLFKDRYGLNIPGMSNLYVYFVAKVLQDLKSGGKFSCIIYDSWQSTKYGIWLKDLINENCNDVTIESVYNLPFSNHLIDATIISGSKSSSVDCKKEKANNSLIFQSKGVFEDIPGFEKISTLFTTKRGLRLKQADFFLCDPDKEGSTRFVKKINLVKGFQVHPSHKEAALLMHNDDLENFKPAKEELLARLKKAKKAPENNISILTWHKECPNDWYMHSKGHKSKLLFNYYLRNRPKHIYNPEIIYSDNFYGIETLHNIPPFAWLAALNSTSFCIELFAHARNQGNGLAKLQLYEYRQCSAPDLRNFPRKDAKLLDKFGLELVRNPGNMSMIILEIDTLIANVMSNDRLNVNSLNKLYNEYDLKARKPKEKS